MSKHLSLVAVVCVLIVGASVYVINVHQINPVRQIHATYAADYSDTRILMGASHNVFVGRVRSRAGNKRLGSSLETQFMVDVLYNIKGNLNGSVLVSQFGGTDHGTLWLENGMPLLEIGTTYVLATRYNAQENWYTVNSHPNAWKLLSSDRSLTTSEIRSCDECYGTGKCQTCKGTGVIEEPEIKIAA